MRRYAKAQAQSREETENTENARRLTRVSGPARSLTAAQWREIGGRLLTARDRIKQTSIQAERDHGDDAAAHNRKVEDAARTEDAKLAGNTEHATVLSATGAARKYQRNRETAEARDILDTLLGMAGQNRTKADKARRNGDALTADAHDADTQTLETAAERWQQDKAKDGIVLVRSGGEGEEKQKPPASPKRIQQSKGTGKDPKTRKAKLTAIGKGLDEIQAYLSGAKAIDDLKRDKVGNFQIGGVTMSREVFDGLLIAFGATPSSLRVRRMAILRMKGLDSTQKLFLNRIAVLASRRNHQEWRPPQWTWLSQVSRRYLSEEARKGRNLAIAVGTSYFGSRINRSNIRRGIVRNRSRETDKQPPHIKRINTIIGKLPAYGSMHWYRARALYYKRMIRRIEKAEDKSLSMKQRAEYAFEARNIVRSASRWAMRNRLAATYFMIRHPNRSFEGLVRRKMREHGVSKEKAYDLVRKSAYRTNEKCDRVTNGFRENRLEKKRKRWERQQ